jgi:hypothetical protein
MTTALVTPTNIDSVLSLQITQLKKAHLRLMRHPETCLYSGIILMGKSEVEDEPYTAYTDGKNKRYSITVLGYAHFGGGNWPRAA